MAGGIKIIVTNRRASYDFELEDRFEAGLVLTGSEVKSLRDGKANLQDAFVRWRPEGIDLLNLYIAPYEQGGYADQEPTRPRRLLLNRSEIAKLRKGTELKGSTIVPTKLYFKAGAPRSRSRSARAKRRTTSATDRRARVEAASGPDHEEPLARRGVSTRSARGRTRPAAAAWRPAPAAR